ncbi:DEAD/DEAH box helicase [Spiractinospora alimapuensis]|nr:DEAD/DEAH box helicase [Spiractinospora alimapuensis]
MFPIAGLAAVFEAADPPRASHMVFWSPDGEAPAQAGTVGVTVAVPRDGAVTTTEVPALRVPLVRAVPALLRADPVTDGVEDAVDGRADDQAHPAARFWGRALRAALGFVAEGRIRPTVTAGDLDAWRVGPLGPTHAEYLRQLVAAMPPEARAIPSSDPVDGASEPADPVLPNAGALLRAFLDAVADVLPRERTDGPPFAAAQAYHVPELRDWAENLAAEDEVQISLRVDLGRGPGGSEQADFHAVLQVHSRVEAGVVAEAADVWRGTAPGMPAASREPVLVLLRRAAAVWPPLEELLRGAVPDRLTLSDGEVADLAGVAGERLARRGVAVHWPRELARDLTSTAEVGDHEPAANLPSLLGGERLFAVNWRLALGGRRLTPTELDQLAEARRPLVRLRDQWVVVPPEFARRAREPEAKRITAGEALAAALSGSARVDGETVEAVGIGALRELRDRIADPEAARTPHEQPTGLGATLRDYQLRGLRWLNQLTSLGLGGCLADDMGLGKTITLIALHLHRQNTTTAGREATPGVESGTAGGTTAGPTLVVCPASLLTNWEREIHRFAPGVAVHRFHGPQRTLRDVTDGFVLTTYPTMRLDAERLAEVSWSLVVTDEAQHVKNAKSAAARELRRIPGQARVALTGTPVENNLSELWAILDWAVPGLLGSQNAFRQQWASAVEGGDQELARRFAHLVRPFLLRRRKTDAGIAPELPPKTETSHPVALSDEQAGLYEAAVRESMERIAESSGMARRGEIMRLLTSLKQICNHPAQYLKEDTPVLPGRSGKVELLDELLDTINAEGGAVLVFTQYVAMGRLLERHLAARGTASQLLHGGLSVAERDTMVRRFSESPEGAAPVFLLSLKAAGTGLNLTRADHVVHFDRWWNPAVEAQATDRAHRIGQTRPVQVHRLVTEGTVEDRIAAMLETKRDLAEAVLGSGEAGLSELSDADLADLVNLRR